MTATAQYIYIYIASEAGHAKEFRPLPTGLAKLSSI